MKKAMKMLLTLALAAAIAANLAALPMTASAAFDPGDIPLARQDNCITFTEDEFSGAYVNGFNPLSIPENALNLWTNYPGGLDAAVSAGAFASVSGVAGANGKALKLDPSVIGGYRTVATFGANIYPGRFYTFTMRVKAASSPDLGAFNVSMFAHNSDPAQNKGYSGNNRYEILPETAGWFIGWTFSGQDRYYSGGWHEIKKTVYVPEFCQGAGYSFTPEYLTVCVAADAPIYVDDVSLVKQSTYTFLARGTMSSPFSSSISLQGGKMVFDFSANAMTITNTSADFELYVKPYKIQSYNYGGSDGMIFAGIKSVWAINAGRTEYVTSFKPVVRFALPDAITSPSQVKVFYSYGNSDVIGADYPACYSVDVANHIVSVDFSVFSSSCDGMMAENISLVIWGQGLTPSDLAEPQPLLRPWWDDWARYTNQGSANNSPNAAWNRYKDIAFELGADAVTAVGGFRDEGIGPFASTSSYYNDLGLDNSKIFKADDIKIQAWIEGWGETRMYIYSIAKDANGNFIIDPKTNAPQIYASYWTWDTLGPNGSSPDRLPNSQQHIAWSGLQDWVNRLPYQGRFVDASVTIPTPTYPDGTSALGYQPGYGPDRPDKAKLYDACASKDLNGDFIRYNEQPNDVGRPNQTGMIDITYSDGVRYVLGDISIGKDHSAPFWLEYARINVRNLLSLGADGFWIDNYIGWDSIRSNNVLVKGFGDWSVWRFANEYLPAHPDVVTRAVAVDAATLQKAGLDPGQGYTNYADFNIKTYMVERYKALFGKSPDAYTDGKYKLTEANWQDIAWQSDPMYMAYLAFKSEQQTKASLDLYRIIKEEAAALGLDPAQIAVTGNDFDYCSNAVMNVGGLPASYQQQFNEMGKALLDIVHTENNGFITLPANTKYPPRGRKGGEYAYMAEIAKSKQACVWLYSDSSHDNTGYGLVMGFDAFANNVMINSGDGISNVVGNDTSAAAVNRVIGILKPWLGYRQRYAEVGIFYSANSEYGSLSPGGYKSQRGANYIPGVSGYAGWAYALEEFNIPYVCVQEARLSEWLADPKNKLLILPYVKSISLAQVDQIKAWLSGAANRRLIITGTASYNELGSFDTRENTFKPHGASLLDQLRSDPNYSSKIVYRQRDPAVEFFINQDQTVWSTSSSYYLWLYGKIGGTPTPANSVNGTLTDSKLSGVLTTIVNIPSGSLGKSMSGGKLTNFQTVYTYVHYDAASTRFFVDLVNYNIDRTTGAITKSNGGSISIALPEPLKYLSASQLAVRVLYDDDGNGNAPSALISRSDFTVSSGVLTINVTPFKTYYTIIAEPA